MYIPTHIKVYMNTKEIEVVKQCKYPFSKKNVLPSICDV